MGTIENKARLAPTFSYDCGLSANGSARLRQAGRLRNPLLIASARLS